MAEGLRQRRPRGRPALPPEKGKRHSIGIRTTKEIRDLLQAAADSSGRSMAQEIEYRLGRSFDSDETFGGKRVAAVLRTLAAAAQAQFDDDEWLDDAVKFEAVRDTWIRLIVSFTPPLQSEGLPALLLKAVAIQAASEATGYTRKTARELFEVLAELANAAEIAHGYGEAPEKMKEIRSGIDRIFGPPEPKE